MPLFGGKTRPAMDGLTKDEEKRRDALNPEVIKRAGGEVGTIGQANAALAILREKVDGEPNDFLWPLLLGRQYMSMRRYTAAIQAFEYAIKLDEDDVRGYYAAAHAYLQAADARRTLGDAATEEVTPLNMTVDNLHQEALRNVRKAQTLADKKERTELGQIASTIEKAVARKAGRL
ncbi:MAG: tetratricopeptide repeat protein [Methylibium sp.]